MSEPEQWSCVWTDKQGAESHCEAADPADNSLQLQTPFSFCPYLWVKPEQIRCPSARLSFTITLCNQETCWNHPFAQTAGPRWPITHNSLSNQARRSRVCVLLPLTSFFRMRRKKRHTQLDDKLTNKHPAVSLSTRHCQICDFWFHFINVLDYRIQFPPYWRRW